VEPPPSFGTRVRIDYLRGMARQGNRFALILDIDRLLAADVVTAAEALEAEAEDGEGIEAIEGSASAVEAVEAAAAA
jgi:purine-binding chemotaxis protein CheW